MVAGTFEQSLRGLARRTPFRPFLVELVSGHHLTVEHPEALVFRAGVAVYIARNGEVTIFDHEGVSRLEGLPGPESQKAS